MDFTVSSLIKPAGTTVLPETRNLAGGGGGGGKRLEKGRQEVWEKEVTSKLICL